MTTGEAVATATTEAGGDTEGQLQVEIHGQVNDPETRSYIVTNESVNSIRLYIHLYRMVMANDLLIKKILIDSNISLYFNEYNMTVQFAVHSTGTHAAANLFGLCLTWILYVLYNCF